MKIVVSRGTVTPFSDLPPKSIALDGYCRGPAIDNDNQRYSFDHHEGCIRFATLASCQQVLNAVLLGLDPDGFTVYVNDVDADTVVSSWILMNPETAKEARAKALIHTTGLIDAYGPAYPADMDFAPVFYGAMAPLVNHQRAKTYGTCDLEALLHECIDRFDRLVDAKLECGDPPPPCEISIRRRGHDEWALIRGDGVGAFPEAYDRGITKAVIYTELPDGSIRYTIGRKSEFVAGFPVGPSNEPGTILHALNAEEAGWGGSSTIGGSPRNEDGSSSSLSPDKVFSIVEGVVAQ